MKKELVFPGRTSGSELLQCEIGIGRKFLNHKSFAAEDVNDVSGRYTFDGFQLLGY
jgi:hypothetical protein